ncbi:MAG: hypothetical protein ACREK3_05630 [Gemmatimonadota bacterium]
MHRLVVPALIMILATACQPAEEPPPEDEGAVDTTAMDTMAMKPDSVSRWVGAGWVARTPNGRACLMVPRTAVPAGDSLRIAIRRLSPRANVLPTDLHPAFRAAQDAGRMVFPPIYDFSAYDASGDAVEQFADSVTFAMCVRYTEAESDAFQDSRLARAVDDSDSLEFLEPAAVPEECQLTCDPRRDQPASARTSAPLRWLAGSPLTATAAHAAAAQTEFWSGLGGKGRGGSPFAAVVPPAGDDPGLVDPGRETPEPETPGQEAP